MTVIEPAINAHEPAIRLCAQQAYCAYISLIGRKPAPMVADFSALIKQSAVYVYRAEHSPLGVPNGLIAGFVVFYPVNDHMHLENIAVDPRFQGRGIGGSLIEYCELCAVKQKLATVELYTNEKMASNLTLYPYLGYREFSRRREDGFDRVYFRKRVAR